MQPHGPRTIVTPVNRVLARLEDGRVVYRPTLWAVPVLLSPSEHANVERSHVQRLLVGIFLALIVFALFPLYRHRVISLAAAVSVALCVLCLSFLVDHFLGRGAKSILKNAPPAPHSSVEVTPSKFEILRSLPTMMIRVLDDKGIRAGLFLAGSTLFSAIFILVKKMLGAPVPSQFNPFVLVIMPIVSGFWLRSLLREKKRRKAQSLKEACAQTDRSEL